MIKISVPGPQSISFFLHLQSNYTFLEQNHTCSDYQDFSDHLRKIMKFSIYKMTLLKSYITTYLIMLIISIWTIPVEITHIPRFGITAKTEIEENFSIFYSSYLYFSTNLLHLFSRCSLHCWGVFLGEGDSRQFIS